MREHAGFGRPEYKDPPPARTHKGYVDAAIKNANHRGPKSKSPYKQTGVRDLSPLAAVPMMNMVWDFLPDMMHVIPGIWKGHVFSMFNGHRRPSKPKSRKTWTDKANRDLMMQHDHAVQQIRSWELAPQALQDLDQRSMALGGEAGWLQNNIRVSSNFGTLKAHDWLVLMHSAGRFLLRGLFPRAPERLKCLP